MHGKCDFPIIVVIGWLGVILDSQVSVMVKSHRDFPKPCVFSSLYAFIQRVLVESARSAAE